MDATKTNLDIIAARLIYTVAGYCGGPRYGEVYSLGAGRGWVSGYRTVACDGLGVIAREHHATRRAAMDRAVRLSQWC